MIGVSIVVLNRTAQPLSLLLHSIPASVQIGMWPNGLSHLHAGSQLQLPVYPHLLLQFPIITGLKLSDVMSCHDLHVTWITMKESCTYISLTLSSKTIQIQLQEQIKMAMDRVRCSGWPWFAKCLIMPSVFHNMLLRCAFLSVELIKWFPPHNLLSPVFTYTSLSVESIKWFPLHNLPRQVFTCKGMHTHLLSRARAQQLPSPGFAG